MSSKKSVNTKAAVVTQEKNDAIRKAASELTADNALKSLSQAQANVSKTLAGVSEQLLNQLQELDTVKKAVDLEKVELQRIHEVGIIAKSIDEMEEAHETKRRALLAAEQEDLLKINENLASARKKFDIEQDEMKLLRQRKGEQYEYDFGKQKQTALDIFNEEIRSSRAQERDRRELLEKSWSERESLLQKQENEVTELKKKVEEFPNVLKTEVDKQTSIVGNTVKRDYEHRISLLSKDAEAAKTVADMNINSLKEQVSKLSAQLADAYTRLAESDKKVEGIANKALEAASGRQALNEVQSFMQGRENGAPTRSKA